jgi:hypothetical protein
MRIISPTPSPVPGNDNEFEELSLQDIDQLSKEQLQALLRGRINSEATTKRERPSSTIPTRFQIEDGELEITKERSCKRQRFSDSDITGDAIVLWKGIGWQDSLSMRKGGSLNCDGQICYPPNFTVQ